MCLQYKSFENTVGKGEIAWNVQFLLFQKSFLPIGMNFIKFEIVVCKFFQFRSVEKLSFGKGLTPLYFTTQQTFRPVKIASICKRQNKCTTKIENIVGKGENVSYKLFLLYSQCFKKHSFSGLLTVVMYGKGYPFPKQALVFTCPAVQIF